MLAPISTRQLIALLDSLHIVGEPQHPPVEPPPPPITKPQITVRTEGAGDSAVFLIDGVRFVGDTTVTVRVVDDALSQRTFQQTSDSGGELHMRQSIPCLSGLPLHISATDSRPDRDPTGVLWSNTVTLPCP
ncbi:hypothetical protein [Streptomyces flaveolus]|jgi:hypothetical protein|uniref:hypothetical protein n=1 Tax=Streptomyces flaveolus TaxID=67297 RepID=UPI00167067CC|nr:hypothetical protein [Streptomyces flaveolus]